MRARYSSTCQRALFTLPWRGRVDCRAQRRQAGWGELSLFGTKDHPTPLASLATLPLQGRVKRARWRSGLLPLQPRLLHHLVPALELGRDVALERLASNVGRLEAKLGELRFDLRIVGDL